MTMNLGGSSLLSENGLKVVMAIGAGAAVLAFFLPGRRGGVHAGRACAPAQLPAEDHDEALYLGLLVGGSVTVVHGGADGGDEQRAAAKDAGEKLLRVNDGYGRLHEAIGRTAGAAGCRGHRAARRGGLRPVEQRRRFTGCWDRRCSRAVAAAALRL
ncbi:hypothetical protein ACFT7S_27040 [Streptomyces sp. NPDC057136]|uniref:hypothetical protein n=1 Tax=Streptomyces sp. NPDC057136 TaxID=3346029 RepID=UPI0036339AAA